jgi:uncharacterized protein YwgA
MNLRLSHRWEHALLATVVAEAKKSCPNCYLGRTAIQKLLYFMNVLGIPMRYNFDIHHFGPFCSDILFDVEWLQADDIIEDLSSNPKYSNYRPGHGLDELCQQYEQDLNKYKTTIQDVVEALGNMDPRDLELIATLDFCYRWVSAKGGNGPWKKPAIKKFKEIKRDKFSDDEIERWYSALVKAKLVKP